jgi:hypothetical protein
MSPQQKRRIELAIQSALSESDVPTELVFDTPHKPALNTLVADLGRYRAIAMELGFFTLATSIATLTDQANELLSTLD